MHNSDMNEGGPLALRECHGIYLVSAEHSTRRTPTATFDFFGIDSEPGTQQKLGVRREKHSS